MSATNFTTIRPIRKTPATVNLTPAQHRMLRRLRVNPRNLYDQPLRGKEKQTVRELTIMGFVMRLGIMAHQQTLSLTPAGHAALAGSDGAK